MRTLINMVRILINNDETKSVRKLSADTQVKTTSSSQKRTSL